MRQPTLLKPHTHTLDRGQEASGVLDCTGEAGTASLRLLVVVSDRSRRGRLRDVVGRRGLLERMQRALLAQLVRARRVCQSARGVAQEGVSEGGNERVRECGGVPRAWLGPPVGSLTEPALRRVAVQLSACLSPARRV